MQNRIVINADDFGLSPSVNKAIIDVYLKGNLNSTTLMVNMPGTSDAVELAKLHPGLAIGLHFTITEGFALTGPSSITDEFGKFFTRPALFKKINGNAIQKNDILKEFKAQHDLFHSFGIPLSHVDSHQHIHMNPFIFEAIWPVLQESRFRIAFPSINPKLLFFKPIKFAKQIVMRLWTEKVKRIAGTYYNDSIISIHDLETINKEDLQIYEKLLDKNKNKKRIELMVHPYILGPDLYDLYSKDLEKHQEFLNKCEIEYNLLMKNDNLLGKHSNSFSLVQYGDL